MMGFRKCLSAQPRIMFFLLPMRDLSHLVGVKLLFKSIKHREERMGL